MSKRSCYFFCVAAVLLVGSGCAGAPEETRVKAILRVNRERFPGKSNDFMIHRETQAALVRSAHVIQSALDDPDLQGMNLNVPSVTNAIRLDVFGNSELLLIEFHHPNLNRETSVMVLDKVLDAFIREIVAKERAEKVDALTRLQKRSNELFEVIEQKTDELSSLAQQLGSLDDAQARLLQSVKMGDLNHLQRKLSKLELKRIKWQKLEYKTGEDLAVAQIRYLTERYRSTLAEVQKFGGTRGELIARKDDLTALRASLQSVQSSIHELELDLEGPNRVTIIQRAQ